MSGKAGRLIDRAREDLDAARFNLDGGFLRTASTRCYYAAFHAARALLSSVDTSPRTHAGVIRQFLLHVRRDARMSDTIARILPRAQQYRLEADYDDGAMIQEADVAEIFDEVGRFIDEVERLLDPESDD